VRGVDQGLIALIMPAALYVTPNGFQRGFRGGVQHWNLDDSALMGDEMNRISKAAGIAVAIVAAVGSGTGIAYASTGDDSGGDTPITGEALERASAAALEHTGGGTVVDSEVDNDEENYYEIEVELADGSITEVELSEDFSVLGTEQEGSDDTNDDD
jgi:hypothetical protein